MSYFVVQYQGHFGFIKPWTAVRDIKTFSQQFLTPSIVEGIEKKLFPALLEQKGIHKIARHRLNYRGISLQQEKTWSKGGIQIKKEKGTYKTNHGIIERGVLLYPTLYLAFKTQEDADIAASQSICLCRNEDLMYPLQVLEKDEDAFDLIDGYELHFTDGQEGFKVGHNRFDNADPMYGALRIYGNPSRS